MQHKTAAYGWISLKWVSFCFWSFKNHIKQYIYRCLENATANRCVNESMDNVYTLPGRCRMRSYREMSAHNFPLRCLSGLSAWKHSIFLLMVHLVTMVRLRSTVRLHVCVVRSLRHGWLNLHYIHRMANMIVTTQSLTLTFIWPQSVRPCIEVFLLHYEALTFLHLFNWSCEIWLKKVSRWLGLAADFPFPTGCAREFQQDVSGLMPYYRLSSTVTFHCYRQ